jgi:hypothetical protein
MMMSKCFIGFLISDLGEPNIYQNMEDFTRKWVGCGVVSDCEKIEGVLLGVPLTL